MDALLFNSCLVSTFLWVSAFYVDKGTDMVIFALITISVSGGYYNWCVDVWNTNNIPKDLSSVGSALSMSVKGIACIIFPIVNGSIMGAKATQETISDCCMFLAIPSSIGCLFNWWFYFRNNADQKRKREENKTG